MVSAATLWSIELLQWKCGARHPGCQRELGLGLRLLWVPEGQLQGRGCHERVGIQMRVSQIASPTHCDV